MQAREESADEKRKKKYGECSFFHDGGTMKLEMAFPIHTTICKFNPGQRS